MCFALTMLRRNSAANGAANGVASGATRRARQRRPRALSSPVRSTIASSPEAQRSPFASPSPTPLSGVCPSPPPDFSDGVFTHAYFSARPPTAPLWLALLHDTQRAPLLAPPPAPPLARQTTPLLALPPAPLLAPPPAPLLAPPTAPLPAPPAARLAVPTVAGVDASSDVSYTVATCEKENSTKEEDRRCRETCVGASPPRQSPLATTLHLPRPTDITVGPAPPPQSVSVQTPREIKMTPRDEASLNSNAQNLSREWAGRLRDGHVRLALRALQQLRRAERLHRALARAPHTPPSPPHNGAPTAD